MKQRDLSFSRSAPACLSSSPHERFPSCSGDIPVAQTTKFGLIVNLKAARALGIAILQALLLRADAVIQ